MINMEEIPITKIESIKIKIGQGYKMPKTANDAIRAEALAFRIIMNIKP